MAARPKREDGGRRMPVDERRAQLLALGLELFGARNPDDISIDEIAEAAGISKGLLYHYFGSKRAYYVACVELAAEQLLAHTQAAEGERGPGLLRLYRGLDAYLEHVRGVATGYAMLVTSGTADPEVRRIVEAARQGFIGRLLTALDIEQPPGLLRSALRGWIAFVETTSLDWLEHQDTEQAEVRELLAQVLMSTLQAAGLSLEEIVKE